MSLLVIREQLLSGEVPPGTKLSDPVLAATFGVSRHTVREAILILTAEGLLQRNLHKGAVVAELGLEELRDAYQARRALELTGLQFAAEQEDDAWITELRASLAAMNAAAEGERRTGTARRRPRVPRGDCRPDREPPDFPVLPPDPDRDPLDARVAWGLVCRRLCSSRSMRPSSMRSRRSSSTSGRGFFGVSSTKEQHAWNTSSIRLPRPSHPLRREKLVRTIHRSSKKRTRSLCLGLAAALALSLLAVTAPAGTSAHSRSTADLRLGLVLPDLTNQTINDIYKGAKQRARAG